MSRRNVVCYNCGKKGRAEMLIGPNCGARLDLPRCICGTIMSEDKTPPKNKKPAVAPDGRKRRHG